MALSLIAAALNPLAQRASAQTATPAAPTASTSEITPELTAAIESGLRWLALQQQPDGSFGSLSHYGPNVAITGLAGMAFMGDGNTPGRGRYGAQVDGCVRFILAHSSESGLLAAEVSHGPMYDHGFGTLFLAEVYGMSPDPNLHEALRRAVRLIATTQNEEGGWRYQPVRNDADISVTVCQVMALRAARNVGIYVDKAIIDNAIEYIRKAQNEDGGFRYMLPTGSSAFPRSAGAVAALQYSGVYHGDEVERGLAYVRKFLPPQEEGTGHYFYGQYYAAQAMYLGGDRYWREWWPAIRDELVGNGTKERLTRQDKEGFWRGQAGDEYGTAMALIVLQMPNRLLPIFQK